MLEASKVLKKHFPLYGEIATKKTGMTEFRLKKIPAHTEASLSDTKAKTHKNRSNKNKTVRK
jgi:hypothetical protein